jgi:Fe-S-cluster-containing dehydrogenase component
MACGNNCSCNNNNAGNQDNSRRDFLVKGLIGGIGAAFLSGCSTNDKTKPESGEKINVLTHDGKLVTVDKSQVANFKPHISEEDVRKGIPGKKFVMVIDLAKCDGCGKCTKACNKMHYLPKNKEWIEVLEMQDSPEVAPYYFPKPCYHCDNPPCTKVCPVDATFKREDGIVAIDTDRCIGCRFCMAACPYSVRLFNWTEPIKPNIIETTPAAENVFQSKKGCVEKCDFCPHMAREGKLPACVTGCPMNAIWFGDANEDAVTCYDGTTTKLSQLLEDGGAYRFMEELGTEPRVYYLPPTNRIYDAKEIKIEKEGSEN